MQWTIIVKTPAIVRILKMDAIYYVHVGSTGLG